MKECVLGWRWRCYEANAAGGMILGKPIQSWADRYIRALKLNEPLNVLQIHQHLTEISCKCKFAAACAATTRTFVLEKEQEV